MAGARLIGLIALVMVGSGLLTWFVSPFGDELVPFNYASDFFSEISDRPEQLADLPAFALLFLSAWVAAGLLAFTGIVFDWAPRFTALFCGLAPFAVLVLLVNQAGDAVPGGNVFSRIGDEFRAGNIDVANLWSDVISPLLEMLPSGPKVFFSAALLLFLMCLIMPSRWAVNEDRRNKKLKVDP
jgi:hypothetical protein